MAYEGYLIKVDDYIFPNEFINEESYWSNIETLDESAERALSGLLIRETLDNMVPVVKLKTIPELLSTQIAEISHNFEIRYINKKERELNLTFYHIGTDKYYTQKVYLVSPKYGIKNIQDGKVYCQGVEYEFIGYGGEIDAGT